MKRKSPHLSRQRSRFHSDQINSKIKRAPQRAPAFADFLFLLLRSCPLFIGIIAVAGPGLQVFVTLSARCNPHLAISAINARISGSISDAVLVAYTACHLGADFVHFFQIFRKEGHATRSEE